MSLIENRDWNQTGYEIVPGVLNSEQVKRLRNVCEELYENNLSEDQGEIIPSRCLANPELLEAIFDNAVVEAISSVIGTGYTVFPNFHVKVNSYVNWHTDKAFMNAERSEESFGFIQCAIYLQPNDPQSGGGLDVLPGTHNDSSTSDYMIELAKPMTLIDHKKIPPPISLRTQAGDFVFWDGRLGHRATQATEKSDTRKFGIHWTVCQAGGDTQTYMERISMRTGVFVDGKLIPTKRFADIAKIRYPKDFPEELRRQIEKQGLTIATR